MQPENASEPETDDVSGDPGCRVDELLKFLAREWMSHIVWTLGREEAIRFGALRRALPGDVSARVLSRRLKELEACGLVSRHDAGSVPPRVAYRLTREGRRLDAALRRSEPFEREMGAHAHGSARVEP